MSNVKVRKLVGEMPIITAVLSGIASFDANGIAEVSADIAEVLLSIEGEYELADASEAGALKASLEEQERLQAEEAQEAARLEQEAVAAQEQADLEAQELLAGEEEDHASEVAEEVVPEVIEPPAAPAVPKRKAPATPAK